MLVVCAIILHHNLILATQRGPGMDLPGKWEFPGGKVDAGEREEEALIREIEEELALTVRPMHRLQPSVHRYPTKTIELVPYICSLEKGEIRLLEHAACRWCTAADLPVLDWAEADVPVVNQVLAWLKDV